MNKEITKTKEEIEKELEFLFGTLTPEEEMKFIRDNASNFYSSLDSSVNDLLRGLTMIVDASQEFREDLKSELETGKPFNYYAHIFAELVRLLARVGYLNRYLALFTMHSFVPKNNIELDATEYADDVITDMALSSREFTEKMRKKWNERLEETNKILQKETGKNN